METEILDLIEQQYALIQKDKQKNLPKTTKKVDFDVKNYLNVRLSDNETQKKITIRIIRLTNEEKPKEPLFKVLHMHYLPSAKRSFVCCKESKYLPEGTAEECPFCDNREDAKEMQAKYKGTPTWDKYKEIYKQNMTTLAYVVRVIDRDDEEFGPKFWKFSEPVFKMIKSLWEDNKEDGIDIYDYLNGKDLVVTIEKNNGNSKVTSVSAKNRLTPVASSKEQIEKLVNDEKKWSDVYGVKTYDYLELLIEGKEPFFDKTINKWVEKKVKSETENTDTTDEDYEEEYNNSHEGNGSVIENNGNDLPF